MGIPARDHGFHRLRVRRVVPETAEARSYVLDVPPELRDAFAYRAGQFCTFRVPVDGRHLLRSYSMSSAPGVDDELQVTVKRVPGGAVSNRLVDTLRPGDEVEVTCPAGVFCLPPGDRDLVAYGAGSGITPVFSLVKAALAGTGRRVRLLYANRDRASVIFAAELAALAARHPGRLDVVHRLDVEDGYVDAAAVEDLLAGTTPGDADHFVCGPAPFMDVVEAALLSLGVDPGRIHVERFTPGEAPVPDVAAAAGAAAATVVTIELAGRTGTTEHHPGTTLLQTARQLGMAPPSSCESGSCATCMARLVDGAADMFVNDALTDDEVAEGWVLTCQSVPTTPTVHVVYGYEGS
jgi:3-ketosteroid 9alpha-monooxygenase subunit B